MNIRCPLHSLTPPTCTAAAFAFEKPHFQLTLEEGGTAFKSDQSLYQAPGTVNSGNFSAPIFGETLNLTSLSAAYGIGASSAYSKAYLTRATPPVGWIFTDSSCIANPTPTSTISSTTPATFTCKARFCSIPANRRSSTPRRSSPTPPAYRRRDPAVQARAHRREPDDGPVADDARIVRLARHAAYL